MRLPRFFSKKRGHRRTGSEVWGSVGEALFHAALVLAGVAFGSLLVTGIAVPEWRINHDFIESPGTVVGKGLARRSTGAADASWQPCLRLRYAVAGQTLEGWAFVGPPEADRALALERLAGRRIGDEIGCWYDPDRPAEVVISRGYNWWMWALTLLLPGALLAFGGAGLSRSLGRWGRSEERQAAAGRRPRDPLADGPMLTHGHPGVPSCEDLVNSPGTILRYRLPIESPESWNLLGLGLFAVLWNAVVVLLAVNAGLDLLGGRIDWLLLAVLVPFAAVGIAGGVAFTRSLVLTTAVGTTQLEISAHPLRPGGTYEALVAQGGSGAFRDLEMSLQVEERATFRQGTDTRTERLVVWSAPLGSWQDIQFVPGTRFEARATIHVPAAAMHSFASEHNSVTWRIVIRGRPTRWPAFTRSFPVIVFPTSAGEPAA